MEKLECKCGCNMEQVDRNLFMCPQCERVATLDIRWGNEPSDKG